MNWISELCDLYDKNAEHIGKIEYKIVKGKKRDEKVPLVLLPVFHTTVAAQITVDIDENGNFLGAQRVADEDKTTIIPVTEASGSRTAGKEPHPFCDNLKYLAGDYMQYVDTAGKDYSRYHQLYMVGLEAWHCSQYTHKKTDALFAYLKKGMLMADLISSGVLILNEKGRVAEKEKIQVVSQGDAFVRFRIIEDIDAGKNLLDDKTGEFFSECWLDRTLQDSYITYYRSALTETDICYMTGEKVPVSYLQPKKIRNEGDGAKLISANDETNYTFRGRFKDKKEAFAIGYETSQKAHNALKWIIRKQGYSWDRLCVVIWESDLYPIPQWSEDTDAVAEACEGWGEEDETLEAAYEGTGTALAARFRAAMRGYGENIKPDSTVILLSFDAATTGRLAMSENRMFEGSQYLKNIEYWHESCRWLQSKYKEGHRYTYVGMAGIKDIAEALYGTEQGGRLTLGKRSRMYAEVCKRLLPCITAGKPIPRDMVELAVIRASSPVSYESWYNWENVLSIACSLVKKERKERKEEEWNLEMNRASRNRDYLYGRLLAVADRIEYRTYDREQDGKRVTNARRYMNVFSQRPYQTWKMLEEKTQTYLSKLSVVERNTYNKLLDEIYILFEPEEFASDERLEGLYLLGFHSQSYDLRNWEEKKEEKNND